MNSDLLRNPLLSPTTSLDPTSYYSIPSTKTISFMEPIDTPSFSHKILSLYLGRFGKQSNQGASVVRLVSNKSSQLAILSFIARPCWTIKYCLSFIWLRVWTTPSHRQTIPVHILNIGGTDLI